ncbi:MAG: hypothetical protein HYX40_10370 [Sphingobacteriales bacterium]|nr:hypothetical protein [Sphingobacteriales bacterium]
MKTGMFFKLPIKQYDIYALLIFFTGTTIALFTKKFYLFDGFQPIFYAALFGFMLSLATKSLWKRDFEEEEKKTTTFSYFLINTILISGLEFLLLSLALFIVWYISRLQGFVIIDEIDFWPNAVLLCVCLGICYSFYSYMEDRFNQKLFF